MYSYSYENLKSIIETDIGKEIVDIFKLEYQKRYEDKPILTNKYSDYKLIYINGNRENYQKTYFDKIKRLYFLQILALSDDNYIEELENVLASICDEFTWVLPAHNLNKDNTFDYTIIDLFSAERAFYLSETVYVFGDKLSQDIKNRIKYSLKTKIIDNYESRQFLFDDCTHNWAAVCACGVGLTYLYQFPERFDKVKDRIFNSMNNYLDGIENDGTTTEGVIYWEYGFGMFSIFHDVYVGLTGDIPATLKNPKVKKTLDFIRNSYLGNDFWLPFADGGAKSFTFDAGVYFAIKNLFGDDFVAMPAKIRMESSKALAFRLLSGTNKFGKILEAKRENGSIYYENSQYFINKNNNYTFVAKCGDNCEKHNHNDVGCFDLVKGKDKIFADLGAGNYTWAYHNDQTENGRYGKEIFVCGSWGHCVPIVNNRPQINRFRKDGSPYRGEVLFVDDNTFKMDIAKAYECGVDSLIIEYKLKENSINVNYECANLKDSVTFRFITEHEPKIIDGGVSILGVELKSKSNIQPKIEKVLFAGRDAHEKGVIMRTAYTIDFLVVNSGNVKEEFIIEID